MAREVFVDAGAWIALSDRRDKYHDKAVQLYSRLLKDYQSLVSTNLVIAEGYITIRHAGGYSPAIKFLQSIRQSQRVERVYSDAALELKAEAILRRYTDHDISFADAVSFVVMRERGIRDAFAFDHHFLIAGFTLLPG